MNTSNIRSAMNYSKSLTIVFAALFFSISLFIYGVELIKRINETHILWQHSNSKAHQKSSIIKKIKQNFTNLNHHINLKRYITKRQATQLVSIERYFINTQQAILSYQSLNDISIREAMLLVKMTSLVEELKHNYILATHFITTKNFIQLTELRDASPPQKFNDSLRRLFLQHNI